MVERGAGNAGPAWLEQRRPWFALYGLRLKRKKDDGEEEEEVRSLSIALRP